MLREMAVAWIQKNCPCVQREFEGQFDQMQKKGMNGSFVLGRDLTRVKKPYLIYCFGGEFFAFELRPDQARNLDAAPKSMHVTTTSRCMKRDESLPALVTLDSMCVGRNSQIRDIDAVGGTCSYRLKGAYDDGYALSLTYDLRPASIVTSWCYPDEPLASSGTIAFEFPPIRNQLDSEAKPWRGTMVAFLRMCTVPDPHVPEGRAPFSTTCGMLVDVV